MYIKIQGGGSGRYANTGSCYGVVSYLRHEDKELIEQNRPTEQFFSYGRDFVSPTEVVSSLDNNKAKLSRNDAKFFVLTISPSKEEIKAMGSSKNDQSKAFKEYINEEVMKLYADGFKKELKADDLLYFAKIHHTRDEKEGEQMHAHIIVSRKDKSNRIKLSPQTNHRNTSKGSVRGGFDRTNFFKDAETAFDRCFKFERGIKDSFEYKNTMKNGTIEDKISIQRETYREELKQENLNLELKNEKQIEQVQEIIKQEQNISRGFRM